MQRLEAEGGLAVADEARVAGAIEAASAEVAGIWEAERPVPPRIIWARILDDARLLAGNALTMDDAHLADARSYSEVPFGGSEPKSDGEFPWDAEAPVEIPNTGFRIAGYIDRLDISGDGGQALVRDYKTGRLPKDAIVIDGGKELQRCLYAFAVRALLGDDIEIAASLLYLRDRVDLQLDDPAAALVEISGYLQAARANLRAGRALMGPDTGDTYDDLAFALPANVANGYRRRKEVVVNERLGELLQYNLCSVRAYLLKEDFQFFWSYKSPYWAGVFLDRWCTRTLRSRIGPMKKFARTLRGHRALLLNWFRAKRHFSSGTVEGFNNKAKLTMRKSYGFRTYKAAEIALYHTLGALPEPKIAHRFC